MRATVTVAAAFALLSALSQPAGASDGEKIWSLTTGYATFSFEDNNPQGGSLGFDGEYGLSDALWLRASATGAAYSDGGSLAWSGHAVFGITYVLDVLEYVPYVNLGAGAIVLDSSDDDFELQVDPLVEIGLGLDILKSRDFSYGFFLRVNALTDTTFFNAGVRFSWRSGFF